MAPFGLPKFPNILPSDKPRSTSRTPELTHLKDFSIQELIDVSLERKIPRGKPEYQDGFFEAYTPPNFDERLEVLTVTNGYKLKTPPHTNLHHAAEIFSPANRKEALAEVPIELDSSGNSLKYSEIWVRYPSHLEGVKKYTGWKRLSFKQGKVFEEWHLEKSDNYDQIVGESRRNFIRNAALVTGSLTTVAATGVYAGHTAAKGEITIGEVTIPLNEIQLKLEKNGLGAAIPFIHQLMLMEAQTGIERSNFNRFLPIVDELEELIENIDNPEYLQSYKNRFAKERPTTAQLNEAVEKKLPLINIQSRDPNIGENEIELFRGAIGVLGHHYPRLILAAPPTINLQNNYAEDESPHYNSGGREVTTPFNFGSADELLSSMSTAVHELGHAFDFHSKHPNIERDGDVKQFMTFEDQMEFYTEKADQVLRFYNQWLRDGGSVISHEKLINPWAFSDFGATDRERNLKIDAIADTITSEYPENPAEVSPVYICRIPTEESQKRQIYTIAARAKTIAEKPFSERTEEELKFLTDNNVERVVATVMNHIFHLQLQAGGLDGQINRANGSKLSSNFYESSIQIAFQNHSATWGTNFGAPEEGGTPEGAPPYLEQLKANLVEYYDTTILQQTPFVPLPTPESAPPEIEALSPQLRADFARFAIWPILEQRYELKDPILNRTEARVVSAHQIQGGNSKYIHFSKITPFNIEYSSPQGNNIRTHKSHGILVHGADNEYQNTRQIMDDIANARAINPERLKEQGITLEYITQEPSPTQSMVHGTYKESIHSGQRLVALQNFPPLIADSLREAYGPHASEQVQVLRFFVTTDPSNLGSTLNLIKVVSGDHADSFPAYLNRTMPKANQAIEQGKSDGNWNLAATLNHEARTISFEGSKIRIALNQAGSAPLASAVFDAPFNLAVSYFGVQEEYVPPIDGDISLLKYYLRIIVREDINGEVMNVPYRLEIESIEFLDDEVE